MGRFYSQIKNLPDLPEYNILSVNFSFQFFLVNAFTCQPDRYSIKFFGEERDYFRPFFFVAERCDSLNAMDIIAFLKRKIKGSANRFTGASEIEYPINR